MRQRRRVLEAHRGRDRLERSLRSTDELGEGALAEREQVGEDPVAGLEPRRGRADRLDDPRDIETDARVPRRTHAVEQAQELRTRRQPVEVGTVHRRGVDADEGLVVDGRRTVDLDELDDVRRAVVPPYGGPHGRPPSPAPSAGPRKRTRSPEPLAVLGAQTRGSQTSGSAPLATRTAPGMAREVVGGVA